MKKFLFSLLFLSLTGLAGAREVLWFPPRVVSAASFSASLPTIAASGKYVFLAWQRQGPANAADVLCARSIDGGRQWEIPRLITADGVSSEPRLVTDGEKTYLFWYKDAAGQKNLWYVLSADQGLNWSEPRLLTDKLSYHYQTTLVVQGDSVYLAWEENREGVNQIFFTSSADFGGRWGEKKQLTWDGGRSPYLAVYQNTLALLWLQKGRIFSSVSSDGGENWGAEGILPENVGYAVASAPAVALSQHLAYLVWQDNRAGDQEIYGKQFTPGRVTDIARLTENLTPDVTPAIALSGQTIHVAWQNFAATGNPQICYRRSTFTTLAQPRHQDEDAFSGYDNDEMVDFSWTSAEVCAGYKALVYVDGRLSYTANSATNLLSLAAQNARLYKIQIFGLDEAGNESLPSLESSSVFVDLVPPQIDVVSPPPGSFIQDELPAVEVTLTETESDVKRLLFLINGQEAPLSIEPLQRKIVYIPSHKYPEGQNQFSLTAIDLANNSTTREWHFTVDNTPPLLNIPPTYLTQITPEVQINGTYSDLGLESIKCGDVKASINTAERSFRLRIFWNYDKNTLLLDAWDKAGNQSQTPARIIFDNQPPSIAELIPPSGSETSEKRIRLSAVITDVGEAGVVKESVKMYFNGMDVTGKIKWEGDKIYYPLKLAARYNDVKITATDNAGNQQEIYWTFIYTKGKVVE